MPNAKLAYQTLDYIEAHPDEWDQDVWFCGTAACFAGRATLLHGDKREPGLDPVDVIPIEDQSQRVYVKTRARRLLGINYIDADYLFDACNTLEDLRELVAEIFGPRPDAAGQEQHAGGAS